MLDKNFVESYKDLVPPWGPIGYIIYKRTYARDLPELNRKEEWFETCERVCNGVMEIGGKFSKEELEFLYDTLFNLRGCVSGRALWQLGTETVRRVGADSLQNCWLVVCDKPSAFTFTFNQLMLGGGVGFNILPENVDKLPPIKYSPFVQRVDSNDCDLIVTDNREGWVKLLESVLNAFMFDGKDFSYSTNCIRPRGTPIKGFGGTASGPQDLVKGLDEIVNILQSRYGQKLRPVDCMDIMNIIGQIVVAGNVRRSSEIAIGAADDTEFLAAKNWGDGGIPNWRAMSNNSVQASDFSEIPDQFWQSGYTPGPNGHMTGEPYGIVNLDACRHYGRLIDGIGDHDLAVQGLNPCAEITLADKEGCNLAEVFLPNIRTLDEFKQVAGILFKVCKTISNAGFSDPNTQAVVDQHHRIGVGLTGWMQAPQWHDHNALDAVYKHLYVVDHAYSKQLGIKTSIKRTTIKPSGTLSLLPGVTPGMHGALGRYYFRTVRFMSDNPLVAVCREHGYRIEPKLEFDGSEDHNTVVIYFPCRTPDNATLAEDMDVIEELEVQKFLQTHWADNSVSATHYFEPGDVPRIKDWLKGNLFQVKSTSFLQRMDHGFKQAPYIPISKEEYEIEVAKVKPITHAIVRISREDLDGGLECVGGSCPVK